MLREENGGLKGALQKAQEGAHVAAQSKQSNEKISQLQEELTTSYKARPRTTALQGVLCGRIEGSPQREREREELRLRQLVASQSTAIARPLTRASPGEEAD